MKIGLETEAFHLSFVYGDMTIFDFIKKTYELGLDGVQINIIPDWNLHPEFGVLTSNDPIYLARVKAEIQKYNLYCEVDLRGTSLAEIESGIDIAHHLGADVVRTYVCFGEFDQEKMDKAASEIKDVVPLLKKYRIKLAVENHEEETADEVIKIIKEVNSPWVGAHCDVGNAMMCWEEPEQAIKKLAPYALTTHFKDHIIVMDGEEEVVCGVPIGTGNINVDECFRLFVEESTLTRLNIETCYPYCTRFKRPKGTGGASEFTGTFEIKEPPFDPKLIRPMDYYHPHNVSEEALKVLMDAQIKGVEVSVAKMFELRRKYCTK